VIGSERDKERDTDRDGMSEWNANQLCLGGRRLCDSERNVHLLNSDSGTHTH